MPNIWTHILFCEDMADSIKDPNPFSKNEAYMKLGAQGPDPFFYYRFWPWIKEERVHDIGTAFNLYDRARTEGLEIMPWILNYWHDRNTVAEQKIADLIGHISYDTGKPLSLGLENKYSEPIV